MFFSRAFQTEDERVAFYFISSTLLYNRFNCPIFSRATACKYSSVKDLTGNNLGFSSRGLLPEYLALSLQSTVRAAVDERQCINK